MRKPTTGEPCAGEPHARFGGRGGEHPFPTPILPYRAFDKLRQVSQASIVENKHLGAVLSHIRERQIERAEARSTKAPRRQGQVSHMFKVG